MRITFRFEKIALDVGYDPAMHNPSRKFTISFINRIGTDTGGGLRAVIAGDGISVSEISEGAQTIAVKLDTVSSDNVLQITEHGLYVPTPKWKQFE